MIPNEEETISESGKAPESRVSTVQATRTRIAALRDGEEGRSMRRALVNGQLNGNPPYKQKDLDLLGRGEDANINLRTGEGQVDAAKTPYYDLWAEVPRMLNLEIDYGPNYQKSYEWGEIISDGLHNLFSEKWDGMDNNMQRKQWQMCVHGIGLPMFDDTRDFRWKSRMVGDVLVPDDAEADIDLLDEAAVPRTYLPTELFDLIKGGSKKWDQELARKAIMNAAPQEFKQFAARNNWEACEESIRCGDISWTNKSNRIPVVDYLRKEFDGRITHAIVLEDQLPTKSTMPAQESFLFKQVGRFDSFSQVLCPFFFDVVGAGLWHGVKGLGPKIYDFCALEDRLTCKNIDQAMLGLIVVPSTADDWETIETVSASGVTAFRPGSNFVQTKLADNLEGPLLVKRDLQNTLQGNTGQYRQRVSAENSEPTLGQAQLNAQQQAMLGRGAVNRYYKSLDRLYREMVRRVFKSTDKDVLEFKEWCFRRGVPEKVFDMKYVCKVCATRSIGYGSPVMREIISNKLIGLLPTMKERGKTNALRQAIAPYVGQSNVDAFYPPFDEAEVPGREEQRAVDENNFLRMKNGETKVIDEDHHLIHFDIAFADCTSHLDELQAGQADPMEVLVHLHQAGPHLGAHLKGLSLDPTSEVQFKQREQALIRLGKITDQLQQQIVEHLKSQAAAQANAQPQLSPELMAAMMKVKGDLQIKQAKAAGDMQLKAEKQQAQLRLKDLQTAHEIRRKNIESQATIATQQAQAAAQPPLQEAA